MTKSAKSRPREPSHPIAFVSYCREDAADVSRLTTQLRCAGIDVRWDDRLPPGEDFDRWAEEQIRECCVFLLCVSERLWTRGETAVWVEFDLAKKGLRRRPPDATFLIPVRHLRLRIGAR